MTSAYESSLTCDPALALILLFSLNHLSTTVPPGLQLCPNDDSDDY